MESRIVKLITPLSFLFAATLAYGQPATTLKDAYKGLFHIGVAVNQAQFEERDAISGPIIASQFNTISPENVLKWESVHPRVDGYTFDAADKYVAFGEKHKMFIVGHTLVWHSQTPAWVFRDDKGAPLSREALLERLHDHIKTVVGRYKGRIGGWDVVNEALNEDGTLRPTQWLKIIGEDYMIKAFQFAREADPQAELYYNDYSVENEAKRNGAVALIKKLQAAGVKVAGMGLQGHDQMTWPTLTQQADTIEAFKALGIKVNITEFDVDVLPRNQPGTSADISTTGSGANPYTAGLPADMQQALAKRYADLFGVFLKYKGTIGRITFWGVTDGDSWLNGFPVRGRTNHPLLFDRQGKPKPAFDAVLKAASSK